MNGALAAMLDSVEDASELFVGLVRLSFFAEGGLIAGHSVGVACTGSF